MITEDEMREMLNNIDSLEEFDANLSLEYDDEFRLMNDATKEVVTCGTFTDLDTWISGYLYAKRGY